MYNKNRLYSPSYNRNTIIQQDCIHLEIGTGWQRLAAPHGHSAPLPPLTKIWDKDSMMAVVKKMLVPSSFVLML
jgi:hypothetical protein